MKRLLLAAALTCVSAVAFAAPASYKIDPNHTMVLASWNHFGFSNPTANFAGAEGTIVYDADHVSASSVQVSIPLASVDTFVPKLGEEFQTDQFFDAAKYPAITFKSTKVESAGAGKLKVTGDLTVHGVTRPVVLDATLNKAGVQPMMKLPAVGFDATTTIKRSEFGVGAYVPMVSDEVAIRITTEAHGEAAAK